MTLGMIVAIKIGSIFIICLVSSTWVTGHNIHGESALVFTAALSRNLQAILSKVGDEMGNQKGQIMQVF